ncbi:glycosyltransferase family 4 protein [Rhizobium sp. ARZ01]|uniref:glycosyltransferase n=1 Tax=Rhizobium sp. ARZ01 TaxID=2769313 RepID=UPI0017853124|nr:glycosyltransferase [Rhizobium sp. ARZ01]MBD9375252.1 glycosyltransferase family 4 protein [Rhizobium sp. ARZ01]
MRLAIFVDQVFWREGDTLSTDESYILFPASLIEFVDEIVFIGREATQPGRGPYLLDHPAITLCPLPYYPSLYQLWRVGPRAFLDIRRRISEQARNWDAILIGGPHPIGQMIARECIALGVPVGLVVRQNLVQQLGTHRGLKRHVAVAAARALDWHFKRLARDRTVFTVGQDLAREYRHFSNRVHDHTPCLMRDAQLRAFAEMSFGPDPTRLICVGRLALEKGHHVLLEALAHLKRRGVPCRLDIVGTGPLEPELKARSMALGIYDTVTFHGFVPYGPPLFELYRQAGALVLPSFTEGFPQVINESLCIGLPTIATAVGGIPHLLKDNETAMLVPPGDICALASAIQQVVCRPELRERLRRNGRALMADNTLEVNRARMIGVLHAEVFSKAA